MEDKGVWIYDMKKVPKKPGVYKIVNIQNGREYIGSSINLYSRLRTQKHRLKNGQINGLFKQDLLDFSIEDYKFEILEVVIDLNTKSLREREQFYINTLNPYYNISKEVGSNKNYKFSKESLLRRSEVQSIPVSQFTLDGVKVKDWKSAREAFLSKGFNSSHISSCRRGIRKTHGGFLWK